jgi:hypothetical protein
MLRVPSIPLPFPPANAALGVLQSDAPLPADWTTGFHPHHGMIKPWQQIISSNRGGIRLTPWRQKNVS